MTLASSDYLILEKVPVRYNDTGIQIQCSFGSDNVAQRAKNSHGQSPPQDLEVSPRSGPYILIGIIGPRFIRPMKLILVSMELEHQDC